MLLVYPLVYIASCQTLRITSDHIYANSSYDLLGIVRLFPAPKCFLTSTSHLTEIKVYMTKLQQVISVFSHPFSFFTKTFCCKIHNSRGPLTSLIPPVPLTKTIPKFTCYLLEQSTQIIFFTLPLLAHFSFLHIFAFFSKIDCFFPCFFPFNSCLP